LPHSLSPAAGTWGTTLRLLHTPAAAEVTGQVAQADLEDIADRRFDAERGLQAGFGNVQLGHRLVAAQQAEDGGGLVGHDIKLALGLGLFAVLHVRGDPGVRLPDGVGALELLHGVGVLAGKSWASTAIWVATRRWSASATPASASFIWVGPRNRLNRLKDSCTLASRQLLLPGSGRCRSSCRS
jgi:hypothetical protein